jgi:sodium/bile acid cotransporter 7
MREFLARRWFLLLLGGAMGLALFWPASVRPVVNRIPDRLIVILSLFLMAWSLPVAQLIGTLQRPAGALWALLISFGLLPGLAWLARPLLPLEDLRIGLLICTSVPCTLSSAVIWTRLAGGNDALAMLATVLSAATGWLATSFWLTGTTRADTALSAQAMMGDLLLVMVVPVAVGQLVRRWPVVVWLTDRYRVANGVAGRLMICVMLIKGVLTAAPAGRELTLPVLLLLLVLCWGLHLAGVAAGLYGGEFLRLDRADRIAAAIAGSQKTLPVGLYLFQTYYQDDYPLALAPLVFYHVSQMVLDTLLAERLRPKSVFLNDSPKP